MDTNEYYSPWDQLPAPEPCTINPPEDYFYNNTAKHLIKDTVRIMMNGLPINLERVSELEDTLDEMLTSVHNRLTTNPYIQQYIEQRNLTTLEQYRADRKAKLRSADDYLKPFDHTKMDHRSYFMHVYSQQQKISQPSELLPTGVSKWPANLVKKLSNSKPMLRRLLAGELPETHPIAEKAMQLLAQHKADIHNRKYLEEINNPTISDLPKKFELKPFNPNSPDQLCELFTMLGLESDKLTPKGQPSWDRANIERINLETTDPDIKELTQALIDHSFGAIIKQNFIPAFYKHTVDGHLYGQYVLFGAKSFRYTSKQPNMLNAPSSRSIYATPVKRCFEAPEGYVIYAIDLSALEDRVIASLSRDTNKCNIFLKGLDGHCLNAYGYFKDRIAEHMNLTNDTVTDVQNFFELQENGHKELKAIRSEGKPATFGLSYGAFPKKIAATLKISIDEAQEIFDNYHKKLYSGITDYRENYVLPAAQNNARLHLGLGCFIKTDNAERDIRTLTNATCQFWSIVTALTINKTHQWIDDNNLQDSIRITSTIYDSIYFIVRKDPALIKQLNDFIVPVMTKDFMHDQTIKNEAAGEIGPNWADLTTVPNNASKTTINDILTNSKSA